MVNVNVITCAFDGMSNIKAITVKSGSIVMVHTDKQNTQDDIDALHAQLDYFIRVNNIENVQFILANPGKDIRCFNETQMNDHGWYRKEEDEQG